MMKIITLGLVALFLLFAVVAAGCGVTAYVSATDVTQPVMLGNKIRVHGAANEQWQLRVPFDLSFSDDKSSEIGGPPSAGSRANVELLKLVETPKDKIVINEIHTGSYNIFVIVPYAAGYYEKSWADIKGGIYQNRAGKDETK